MISKYSFIWNEYCIMKSIKALLFSTLIFSLLTAVVAQAAYADKKNTLRTLLILGDSLSAAYGIKQDKSWTNVLQKKLQQNNKGIQIINASISGDTTANGINRLTRLLEQQQAQWVIIELGANDGLRGLSISHIKHNLQSLINISHTSGAKVLLMEIKIPPNYGKKYTRAFNQIYHQLAADYSLILLPFMLDEIILKPELMQADGLHPNERAQLIISNNLWQALEPVLHD